MICYDIFVSLVCLWILPKFYPIGHRGVTEFFNAVQVGFSANQQTNGKICFYYKNMKRGNFLMKEILNTNSLTKRYKDFYSVNNLNMTVKEGTIYGFLGPNGAGKSTTLKMLLGLVSPTKGRISIFGTDFNSKSRINILKNIGSLIESPSYYGHLTASENLKIYSTILNLPDKNIDEVLKIVRLDKQRDKKTSAFSLGMKQRLGLASALLSFPKLLILDEPTNGLDPAGIQEMRELICSLPQKYNMTVIISSHLLSEIDQIVDDIGIIANGKMMYQGSLDKLHETDKSKNLEEIFLDLTGKDLSL